MSQVSIAERAPDATAPTVTKDQMDLITRTVAQGATPDELKLYLFDCARQGVHPLDKLIHFTKRKGKYTPITSIDFMRIRAAETNEYAGSDDAVFEAKINATAHEPFLISATVTVWRLVQNQRCSFTATARWSEYYPGDGDGSFMWRKMPHTMLAKCAEALALRKGFPRQLAGLYAKEELDQAGLEPQGIRSPDGDGQNSAPRSRSGMKVPLESAAAAGSEPAESHTTDNGPDLGADLPPGARLVVKVGPGRVGAEAEIQFDAPMEGGKDTYLTWNKSAAAMARELERQKAPCFVDLKKSTSGNWRVERLMMVPDDYMDAPA